MAKCRSCNEFVVAEHLTGDDVATLCPRCRGVKKRLSGFANRIEKYAKAHYYWWKRLPPVSRMDLRQAGLKQLGGIWKYVT